MRCTFVPKCINHNSWQTIKVGSFLWHYAYFELLCLCLKEPANWGLRGFFFNLATFNIAVIIAPHRKTRQNFLRQNLVYCNFFHMCVYSLFSKGRKKSLTLWNIFRLIYGDMRATTSSFDFWPLVLWLWMCTTQLFLKSCPELSAIVVLQLSCFILSEKNILSTIETGNWNDILCSGNT